MSASFLGILDASLLDGVPPYRTRHCAIGIKRLQ